MRTSASRLVAAILIVAALGIAAFNVTPLRRGLRFVPVIGAWLVPPGDVPHEIWTCTMHPEVREPGPGRCPKCGMALVKVDPATGRVPAPPVSTELGPADALMPLPDDTRTGVTLDTRRQQLIGVRTVAVHAGAAGGTLRAVGIVKADETRQVDVNVKVDGWIRDLRVDFTGRAVRKGEPLFTLYSPDLIATQREYLLALDSAERLRGSPLSDARDYADRLVEAARQRLRLWDLSPEQLAELDKTRTAPSEIVISSPASGIVTEKLAVQGMRVTAGQTLYRLADLSRVWIEGDVPEADSSSIRLGSRASIALDALPGEELSGRVTYISPFVDDKTRAARVRFEVANPRGRVKPGMFASIAFELPRTVNLTVPMDALLDSGVRQMVFVALGDGRFEPRQVRIGRRLDGVVEVLAGLREGEEVASAATFFLDSESQLRAALQGYAAPPEPTTAAVAADAIKVELRTDPTPPRTGETTFEVEVREADGRPISDAEVRVVLYMPPMPSMNMPAMRSESHLPAAGNGLYRGRIDVMMAGRWDVTIDVTRGGRRAGSAQRTMVAR